MRASVMSSLSLILLLRADPIYNYGNCLYLILVLTLIDPWVPLECLYNTNATSERNWPTSGLNVLLTFSLVMPDSPFHEMDSLRSHSNRLDNRIDYRDHSFDSIF